MPDRIVLHRERTRIRAPMVVPDNEWRFCPIESESHRFENESRGTSARGDGVQTGVDRTGIRLFLLLSSKMETQTAKPNAPISRKRRLVSITSPSKYLPVGEFGRCLFSSVDKFFGIVYLNLCPNHLSPFQKHGKRPKRPTLAQPSATHWKWRAENFRFLSAVCRDFLFWLKSLVRLFRF